MYKRQVRRCNKKQLLAVGPEKLHTVGTKQKHGDTETYKALPRKDIFRTFNVVRRNTSKIKFGGSEPDDINDSLSFSTKEQLKALTILPYAK